MQNSTYDVIVVGGGHNGLVNAAYFARAGARTLVLEARDRVGGAADTSSPFPDHPEIRVSTYSYVMAVMPPSIIRDLELPRHGYRIAPVWGASHLLPDGSAVQLFNDDPQRTHDSIARFSKADAERYPEWQDWIGGAAAVVGPLLMQVPPRMGSLSFGDLWAQAQVGWKMRKLGVRGVADLTRLFAMSVTDLLDAWFESEAVKGAVASGAVIGSWAGPDAPGTAYGLLHHSMSDVGDGTMDSWGYPHGGMGAVAQAIRRSAESAGCEVRTGARVARILTRGGRAVGVALENSDELRARVVVTTLHPKRSFLELLDSAELPDEFRRDIQRWRTRSGTVKINVALSELPDCRFAPGTELQEQHTGSLVLSFSPAHLEQAFQDANVRGVGSEQPFCEGTIPSSLDPELAPKGVHVFSMFSQWVPHGWSQAPHREELDAYADRLIGLYDDMAPNFRRSVIDRQVLGPWDMEQELGMLGGNIFHGELCLDQLFHMRPSPGWADYRSPIRGLYHASSATHAGGGVNGIPGLQAFRQARRDGALRAGS